MLSRVTTRDPILPIRQRDTFLAPAYFSPDTPSASPRLSPTIKPYLLAADARSARPPAFPQPRRLLPSSPALTLGCPSLPPRLAALQPAWTKPGHARD